MTSSSSISHDQFLANLLPESVARENRCVAMFELGQTLVVGRDVISDQETIDKLRFILNRPIRMIRRTADWVAARIDVLYSNPSPESQTADEEDSVTWYWPAWYSFEPGTLKVKCSGWIGMTHWTGCHPVRYDDPDIDFWIWFVKQKYYGRLVKESEIPKIQRIWRRYLKRCGKASE